MKIKHLDHLNMTVRNLDESVDWYKRVFGFEPVEGGLRNGLRWAILQSGDALLCIYEHPELAHPERSTEGTDRHTINHFGLRITDRDQWERIVEREKLHVLYDGEISYPGSASWYVVDPTGYEIEVALWNEDKISFRNPVALSA